LAGAASGMNHEGSVSFNQPLHLRTEMDIAAALTDVLTTRMKPPPQPPRDLKLSTAFWLLLTGVSVALLGMSLFTATDHRKWVAYLGVAQMAIGYIWIVSLVYRRDPSQGMACLIPPITIWYLSRRRYMKYRPARFVMTGALIVALAGASKWAAPATREWVDVYNRPTGPTSPDLASQSEVVQLRTYRDNRETDRLIELLRKLDRTDPTFSATASHRVELAAELKLLCDPATSTYAGVRAAALPAYVRWGGDDARSVLLQAIQSGAWEERREAIKLLPRWRDPEVARAIASRIGYSNETTYAKAALIELGGPVAEQAVIPLLLDPEKDKVVRLNALDLLAEKRICGEAAMKTLRDVVRYSTDETLRSQAEQKLQEIRAREREKS
jgi:hypothetical protein